VSAALNDTYHSPNRVTISPSGEIVSGCSGVQGTTSATENFELKGAENPPAGISCTYTVLSGATVLPGQTLGTEVISIPPTASPGSAIVQVANGCSDGPGSPCGGPATITASGPGGVVRADPPFTVSGQSISAAEGQVFTGTVATISDTDPNASTSEYVADVAWGDGTQTQASISGWSVIGSHTYAEEGVFAVTVSVTDRSQDHTVLDEPGWTATVADASLAAQGKTINTTNPFNGTIATFTDADPGGTVTDYAATVDWGDGTTSPGTIAADGAGFDVNGTHVYAQLGPYTVTVHACDVGGACADASSNVLVFEYTTGGNFVIGDGNAAVGSAVTFWGAQWASANTETSGTAPADFKGFADSPNGPISCGTGWSTSPGNSSHPPDSIPNYTAVIVTSNVSQDGPRTAGDSPQVVIVKTDPGYQPDPGHSGTGNVVAVLCP
jgi:hypothetical protein